MHNHMIAAALAGIDRHMSGEPDNVPHLRLIQIGANVGAVVTQMRAHAPHIDAKLLIDAANEA